MGCPNPLGDHNAAAFKNYGRIELRSAGDIAQAWFDDIHLDATASASGVTPTTITPYIPLPSVNPDPHSS